MKPQKIIAILTAVTLLAGMTSLPASSLDVTSPNFGSDIMKINKTTWYIENGILYIITYCTTDTTTAHYSGSAKVKCDNQNISLDGGGKYWRYYAFTPEKIGSFHFSATDSAGKEAPLFLDFAINQAADGSFTFDDTLNIWKQYPLTVQQIPEIGLYANGKYLFLVEPYDTANKCSWRNEISLTVGFHELWQETLTDSAGGTSAALITAYEATTEASFLVNATLKRTSDNMIAKSAVFSAHASKKSDGSISIQTAPTAEFFTPVQIIPTSTEEAFSYPPSASFVCNGVLCIICGGTSATPLSGMNLQFSGTGKYNVTYKDYYNSNKSAWRRVYQVTGTQMGTFHFLSYPNSGRINATDITQIDFAINPAASGVTFDDTLKIFPQYPLNATHSLGDSIYTANDYIIVSQSNAEGIDGSHWEEKVSLPNDWEEVWKETIAVNNYTTGQYIDGESSIIHVYRAKSVGAMSFTCRYIDASGNAAKTMHYTVSAKKNASGTIQAEVLPIQNGDINNDGCINAKDLALALAVKGKSDSSAETIRQRAALDTDCNGYISDADFVYLIRAAENRSVNGYTVGCYDPMYDADSGLSFNDALEELFTLNGTTYYLSSMRSDECRIKLKPQEYTLKEALQSNRITPQQLLELGQFRLYYQNANGTSGFCGGMPDIASLEKEYHADGWSYGFIYY